MAPGTKITSLNRAAASRGAGADDGPRVRHSSDEEEVSLRSLSPTVRVDIARLDAVMRAAPASMRTRTDRRGRWARKRPMPDQTHD